MSPIGLQLLQEEQCVYFLFALRSFSESQAFVRWLVHAEMRRSCSETVVEKLRQVITDIFLEEWRKTMKNLGRGGWIADQKLN